MLATLRRLVGNTQQQRGSSENPKYPITWDGLAELFGVNSASGEEVTPQTALKVAAFWQGVSLLSGEVAKLPLERFQREGKDRTATVNHPVYKLVRHQANPETTSHDFFETLIVHSTIWNNGYAWIRRNNRGEPRELYNLLPDRTRPRKLDGRQVYESEIDNQLVYFDHRDIFHIKGLSLDGCEGYSLISAARDVFGLALGGINFASKFFKNGGRVGGILELNTKIGPTGADKLEEGFRKKYQTDDAFSTVILRDGAKFHEAQRSFKDTQLIEGREADVKEIARLLKIPPHKLGVAGTASYNSLEQENRAFYDNCLSHWLEKIKSECWFKLQTAPEKSAGNVFFDYTIGALLWADAKTVASIISDGVIKGWLLRNEGRRWFNLPGVEGFDEPLVPSGMVETPTDPDAEEMTRAMNDLRQNTDERFIKRLTVHATKAAKRADFNNWLSNELPTEQLEHGRKMYEPIDNVRKAAGLDPEQRAEQLVKHWKTTLAKAHESDTLTETINQLSKGVQNGTPTM